MPGTAWKRSLKRPDQYEAVKKGLIREGVPEQEAKTKAARITNAPKRKGR